MRKVSGVLLAVAMTLPVGLVASPAGAAGGTTCKTNTSVATFKPALPILGSKVKVAYTVTSVGKLSGCVGGGVTSGTYKTVQKVAPGNCTTLLTYNPKPGNPTTITTTWNTKKTSTGTFLLHAIKGNTTKSNVTGSISAGLFKGLKITTAFTFTALTKNGCTKVPLAQVSVKGASAVVIK
jgi:hypothetical protein